jgi:hypothetical protein
VAVFLGPMVLTQIFPPVFTPQGSAEMTSIGRVCADPELDYTIFRVPNLLNGPLDEVYAGMYGEGYKGAVWLSRAGMVRWVWKEVGEWEGSRSWGIVQGLGEV